MKDKTEQMKARMNK